VTLDFKPDAGIKAQMGLLRKIPGPGQVTLLLNGQKVGETHFSKFGGFASSIDEPLDIGRDSGSPVSAAYQSPNPYSGHVTRVTIDLL
jgi:hypothetical protein